MLNIEINEITQLLKQLGISGQDGPMSSQKTRKVVVQEVDIIIDGNLPIILNSELFTMINKDTMKTNCEEDIADEEYNEPYDPSLPLYEQFTTIKEFAPPVEDKKMLISRNYSNCETPKSLQSTTTTSEAHSLSTSYSDESSSCSSNIITISYSEGEEDSYEEMFEPLLKMKQSLYTPRQLYEHKKLQENFQKHSILSHANQN